MNEAGNYTKPTMRKRLFERIKAGGKGGRPGQWSARKAQMLAAAYKKAADTEIEKEESMALRKSQKSLRRWTKQKWRTKSGKPSTQGPKATGERYLPEKAIKALSSVNTPRLRSLNAERLEKVNSILNNPKDCKKNAAIERKNRDEWEARAKKERPTSKGQKNTAICTQTKNPKGTIKGLKFATVKDAEASVRKIKRSGRTHAHKIQAAIAMEQRAKVAGKSSAGSVYRRYINAMKKKTVARRKKS